MLNRLHRHFAYTCSNASALSNKGFVFRVLAPTNAGSLGSAGAMRPSTFEEMPDSLMASRRRFMTWGRRNAKLLATGLAIAAALFYTGNTPSKLLIA